MMIVWINAVKVLFKFKINLTIAFKNVLKNKNNQPLKFMINFINKIFLKNLIILN